MTAYSAYRVEINSAAYRLTAFDAGRNWILDGRRRGSRHAYSAGRTFLLASMAPIRPTYSPLILPLGLHSDTLTTFGGGPGTVGLHGWPDTAVFGHAVSHGCVPLPAATLRILSQIPLGSSVMIVG